MIFDQHVFNIIPSFSQDSTSRDSDLKTYSCSVNLDDVLSHHGVLWILRNAVKDFLVDQREKEGLSKIWGRGAGDFLNDNTGVHKLCTVYIYYII